MTLRALFPLLIASSLAHAADTPLRAHDSFNLTIERQALAGALQQLARQCDVQVIFFSRVIEGLSAPAIDGKYTLDAAMERLLAGSGLTFRVINPQTVEVRPTQARAASKRQPPPVSKLPGWSIGAGYTYNDNEDPDGEPLSTITPKHLLKAWTSIRLPGALDRWEIGGGVHAQSRTTIHVAYTFCPAPTFVCIPVDAVQPEYAVLDLRAGFEVDRNWRIALSVNNVFDKVYYESLESNLHAWYGEPRNWMLRIDGRY